MTAPEMYSLMQGVEGVNAFAATCQSALETGRWMSKLWVQARNGAGLKAGRSWINASADNFWGYFAGLYHGKWGAWATDPIYFTKLAQMAVSLAPELLGHGWRGRMLLAFNLACQRGTLNDYQRKAAEKILREVDEK